MDTKPETPIGQPLSHYLSALDEEDPLRVELTAQSSWLLLDFWASWCQPCIRHQAEMRNQKERLFDAKGVTIVGVSINESPQVSKISHENRGLPWPTFPDVASKLARPLGATSIPQYVLVNETGIIHGVYTNLSEVKSALNRVD